MNWTSLPVILSSTWDRVIASRFLRDAAWVVGANAIAQGAIAAAAPILTRLYSPAELGTAVLFFALVQIAAPFVDGRLTLIIPLPKNDVDAIQVVAAVLALTVATCVIGQAAAAIFGADLASRWGGDSLAAWLWLLPSTLAISSAYQTLRMWGLRAKRFSAVASSTIYRALVNASYPVVFVLLRPTWIPPEAGLLLAPLVADAIGNAFLSWRFRSDRTLWKEVSLGRIKRALQPFGKTVRTLICSQALNAAYGQIPIFAIGLFFGPAEAGLYALAERVSVVPTQIVGRAFGDVYRQRAVQLWHSGGDLHALAFRAMLLLGVSGAIPYAAAALLSPAVFPVVFGEAWREAGTIASIFFVSRFILFVQSGTEWTTVVVGANGYIVSWHALRGFLLLSVSGAQHYLTLSFLELVAVFATVDSALWLLDIVVAQSMARKRKGSSNAVHETH